MTRKKWGIGVLVLMLLFTGCSSEKNSNSNTTENEITPTESVTQEDREESKEETTDTETEVEEEVLEESNEAVEGEIVDLDTAPTEKMLSRSVTNEGNLARLALAMEKSKAGEEVTIAYIGGSITQGSSASSENQYVNQVSQWWEENLGPVQCVNAGVGATNSYLGVHRLERDVLSQNPDVIFVEFAVNDTDTVFNKYSYDSLLLKCMKAENQPAIVLIMMTQEDGTSLEEVHTKLGVYYDLPVLSYRSMIYPEVSLGNITWSDISPDNIHPNDVGHTILAKMITSYLENVMGKLDTVDTTQTEITVEDFSDFYYENARLVNRESDDVTYVEDEGEFTEEVSFQTFEHGWGTTNGGTITIHVEARNFGLLYLKDTSGTYGKAEIYIDGELFGYVDGDYTGGWGNYLEGYQVYSRSEVETHTIQIVVPEGSSFEIESLLIS